MCRKVLIIGEWEQYSAWSFWSSSGENNSQFLPFSKPIIWTTSQSFTKLILNFVILNSQPVFFWVIFYCIIYTGNFSQVFHGLFWVVISCPDPRFWSVQLFVQNIVLIRDSEDPRKFYPRFNIEDTSSFKDLDDHRYVKSFYFGKTSLFQTYIYGPDTDELLLVWIRNTQLWIDFDI